MVWPGAQFYSSAHLWGEKLLLQQPDQTSSSQTKPSGTVFSSRKQEGCSRFPCKGLTKLLQHLSTQGLWQTAHPEAGGKWDLAALAWLQSCCKWANLIQSKKCAQPCTQQLTNLKCSQVFIWPVTASRGFAKSFHVQPPSNTPQPRHPHTLLPPC